MRFAFPTVSYPFYSSFRSSRYILPDADLDAAADGVHLPGIKRSEILPALAFIYRRNLL